jgi:hypothetical protein
MRVNFEELDYQRTALGELILRRRRALGVGGREIFEVKLNDEYLMSSLFHEGEVALTDLGLAELTGEGWDVVVGGLGLGYTAAAALKYDQVARMIVVEALAPVIEWHQRELVPNGTLLSEDARCHYYHEDFFALARSSGFDPDDPGHLFDAILLDIDHTPGALLTIRLMDMSSSLQIRFRAKRRRMGFTSRRLRKALSRNDSAKAVARGCRLRQAACRRLMQACPCPTWHLLGLRG